MASICYMCHHIPRQILIKHSFIRTVSSLNNTFTKIPYPQKSTAALMLTTNKGCISKDCSLTFRPYFHSNRRFSDSNDGENSNVGKNPSRVLPRRLIKRLQNQGITEEEFLKRLNATSQTNNTISPGTSLNSDSFVNSKEDLEMLLKSSYVTPREFSEVDSFPSDMKKFQQWKKQEDEKIQAAKVKPSDTSIVLFPGQGSQFVGMGKKLTSFPGVNDLFNEASSILGYDLLQLCLEGPKEILDKTVYCQPAVMITSLAAIEKLREEHPQVVENCVATAGFSVGEITALVFAGVLSFPDAVRLIKIRAEAMQNASERVSSGMMTVFLAHDSDLKGAMMMAREYCEKRCGINEPICGVANYLFPEAKVIAGHSEALEFISTNAKEFRILRTRRLPVSGAFHTQLMKSATKPVKNALEQMQLGHPKIPVHSNLTGTQYAQKSNLVNKLQQHMIKPVCWEQTMQYIYKRPQGVAFPNTYEVGPGTQMGTFLKQVNMQAHKQYYNISV